MISLAFAVRHGGFFKDYSAASVTRMNGRFEQEAKVALSASVIEISAERGVNIAKPMDSE